MELFQNILQNPVYKRNIVWYIEHVSRNHGFFHTELNFLLQESAVGRRLKFKKKVGKVMPQFVQSEQQRELISSLVQELPAYRKKMRMSQAELGDAVGKSRQKISEMERGSAPLGWDTYLAILMVLGAHGVLEPRGRDAERLAATGRLIGGRIRF